MLTQKKNTPLLIKKYSALIYFFLIATLLSGRLNELFPGLRISVILQLTGVFVFLFLNYKHIVFPRNWLLVYLFLIFYTLINLLILLGSYPIFVDNIGAFSAIKSLAVYYVWGVFLLLIGTIHDKVQWMKILRVIWLGSAIISIGPLFLYYPFLHLDGIGGWFISDHEEDMYYGIFHNANYVAIASIIFYTFSSIFYQKGVWTRILFGVIALLGVYSTQERSYQLTLLVLFYSQFLFSSYRIYFKSVVLLISLVALYFFVVYAIDQTEIRGTLSLESTYDRFALWLRAIDILNYFSFMGASPTTTIKLMSNEGVPFVLTKDFVNFLNYNNYSEVFQFKFNMMHQRIQGSDFWSSEHNTFISLIVDFGILGFFAVVAIILYPISYLLQIGRRYKNFHNGVNVALFLMSLNIAFMFTSQQQVLWFFALLFMFHYKVYYRKKHNK